ALIAAKLIAVAALNRQESRGGHYRTDHPNENPALAQRSYLTLSKAETMIEAYMAQMEEAA
ncbi:MAG: L-aspartate oxidase, partial [Pseudomonadota bacterium]